MRRFRPPQSRLLPERRHGVATKHIVTWRMDEGSSTDAAEAFTTGSGASSNFELSHRGAANVIATGPFSTTGANARTIGGGGWFEDFNTIDLRSPFTNDVTVSLWFTRNSAVTAPIWSFDANNTALVIGDYQALGLNVNADGGLWVARDSGSGFVAIPVGNIVQNTINNIVVTSSATPVAGWRSLNVYVNGVPTYTASSLATGVDSGSMYLNSRFSIGAAFRTGISTGTPYVGLGTVGTVSDAHVWSKVQDWAKARAIYADGVRPWDEYSLVKGGNYRCLYRALVEDQDGQWVDLSNHYERNWVQSASVSEAVDSDVRKGSVKLHRRLGRNLNLGPLDATSILNLDANAVFEELLMSRRQVRIESAMVPATWRVQGWEWEIELEGFIDTIDWADDTVTLACLDRTAPLGDMFQLEPREYPYFDVTVKAETHLQTLIDNNTPYLLTSAGTVPIGYKGGAMEVYTPNSTGWAIRHDESPADTVMGNLTRITDQTAWDLRWIFNEHDAKCRLSYYDPNRTRAFSCATIWRENGGVVFRTVNPNKFQVGQKLQFTDAAGGDYDSSAYVISDIRDSHTVGTVGYDPGGGGVYTAPGTLYYSEAYVFESQEVLDISKVNQDIKDVRNQITVKYLRETTACSYLTGHISSVTIGSPGSNGVRVQVPLGDGMNYQIGDEFTISGLVAPRDVLNGTYSVGSIAFTTIIDPAILGEIAGAAASTVPNTAIFLYGAEPNSAIVSAVTSTTCSFRSDIIKFRQVQSTSTTSINKYGLKPASISEGSTTNIYTREDAQRLADRVRSDLSDPNTSVEFRIKYMRHLELHDWVGIEPDSLKRWSARFTGAVTSLQHTFDPNGCTTVVGLRYSAPTRGAAKAARVLTGPFKPSLPTRHIAPLILPGGQGPTASVKGTRSIRVMVPPSGGSKDARYRRTDHLEVHVSTTTEGFIPNLNTLAGRVTGEYGEITQYANGSDLTTATNTFIKLRWIDVYGNPSTWTSVSAQYPAINPFPESYSTCSAAVTHTNAFRVFTDYGNALGNCVIIEHPGMCYAAGGDAAGANTAYVRDGATFDSEAALMLTNSSVSVRGYAYTPGSGDLSAVKIALDENSYVAPQDGWYSVKAEAGVGPDFVTARTVQYDMHIVNVSRVGSSIQDPADLMSTDTDMWVWSSTPGFRQRNLVCTPTGTKIRRRLALSSEVYALKGEKIGVWITAYNSSATVHPFFCDHRSVISDVSASSGSLAHNFVRIKLLTDD